MKFLHLPLILASVFFWSIAMFFMLITIGFSLLMLKLYPDSLEGNCWSYALPRWIKHGGYLAVGPAAGQRFLNYFFIPHVIWVKKMSPETELEQLVPIRRKSRSFIPYYTLFFKGKVNVVEKSQDATNS